VAVALVPFLNLTAALLVAGLVVLAAGESPLRALGLLVGGALGNLEALAFTLHYATTFLLAGLAVALPFHAGQFNIGGEGQAYVGGLGVAAVCLSAGSLPWWLAFPAAVLAAALCGAAWAAIPALLQTWRGSHLVITTIMFNFIASALMAWLLTGILRAPDEPAPESRAFAANLWPPRIGDLLNDAAGAPLNLTFVLALAVAGACWLLLRRSVCGFEIRAVGLNPTASLYAGVPAARRTFIAIALGGALAGLVAVNEVLGAQHRLVLGFPGGAGFVGIAVALMGRNHPFGICIAAVLFGALAQGGAELAFDMPALRRETLLVVEGLVVLFCGAFEHLLRRPAERLVPNPALP
jgi:simple sugar transport system permease protein